MDFVRPESGKGETVDSVSVSVPQKRAKRKLLHRFSKKSLLIFTVSMLLVLSGAGVLYWRLFIWQPAVVNPFSTGVIAAMKFPLYYPTNLPSGFKIDTKSVTQPSDGVVVFTILGPKGEKLYMSEEARPSTFDLGGFYKKFEDLKEYPVSDGTVAVGRVNSGATEIVSRANNKTWILSNTQANIPPDQLVQMLKSLTLSV